MKERPILLDTCAAIWLSNSSALTEEAEDILQEAQQIGRQILLSPITAWEVGMLVSKGRLLLTLPPLKWFEAMLESGVDLAEMSPEVLVSSSTLPGDPLRDPADRIIAATARLDGYTLMTRDKPLLAFAAAGHATAIAC